MTILVAVSGFTTLHKQRLRDAAREHELLFLDEHEKSRLDATVMGRADIVFGNVPSEWLLRAPHLQWVQLDSAGVDGYLGINKTESRQPALLTNLSGVLDRAVAEIALAGILAFYRQLPRLLAGQRERRWVKYEVTPDIEMLHGKRVLLLGTGAIGRRLMTLLNAFECEVHGFSRSSSHAQLHSLSEVDAILPRMDIVINSLPQTPETIGILSRERLGLFSAKTLLVNVGRGSAVDEVALIEALDTGRIHGAVLDVTAKEPLEDGNPLWGHPKVILSQHTGGRFQREAEGKIDLFLRNLKRFENGETLEALVDTSRGY